MNDNKKIQLYYWDGAPNFGDQLNIDVCRKLFNVEPVCSLPKDCEAAFIGSLLDDFLCLGRKSEDYCQYYDKMPAVQIWGSGFIMGKHKFLKSPFFYPECYFRKISLHAVRGKSSLKRLEKIFHTKFSECVLGDPGLIALELLDLKKVQKQYRVGIIPHHLEKEDAVFKNICIKDGILIDIEAPVEEVINNIAKCEVIASSALHGLIVADSLGIPNGQLVASDKMWGGNYKFDDYNSGLDYCRTRIDIRKKPLTEKDISTIEKKYCLNLDLIERKKEQLFKSFPFR